MGHVSPMTLRLKALSVHLFTATGAVFAMLAMLAAVEEEWPLMFLWLGVAFIVDGWHRRPAGAKISRQGQRARV